MLPDNDEIKRTYFPNTRNNTSGGSGGSSGGTPTTPRTPTGPSTQPSTQTPVQPIIEVGQVSPSIPLDYSNINIKNGTVAGNYDQQFALELIDSLQKPPPQVTQEYTQMLGRVCSFLGRQLEPPESSFRRTGARQMWAESSYPEQSNSSVASKNVNNPTYVGSGPESQEKLRNDANRARNEIFDVMNKVSSFVARATNAGFVPSANPFIKAMSYNSGRVGFTPVRITSDVITSIANDTKTYLKLLSAEENGQLNLDHNTNKAAQLSSARFSLEGFGGTGNTAVDLSKLLPDADSLKAQKALEALSVFDFTKRVPKMIFTAFYAPDGIPKGVIVGWKKVADASGYVLRRKSLFDSKEVVYNVTNDEAQKSSARLQEYVKAWITSFYDNNQHSLVYSYLDADVQPHSYYTYSIKAYQLQNEAPGAMFQVETSPIFLSNPMKAQIRAQLETLDPGAGADTISPYPVLAHILLGDAKYDWLLAAINIRQSINRGDTRTTTRGYSYLAAQLNFLFSQADAGKLVVPKGKDMSGVMKNIGDAISKFGVNQVLKEALQETGALYHFEGKDPNDNQLFRNIDVVHTTDSGLISTMVAAIDPETATMDLRTLSTNLPKLLNGEYVTYKDKLSPGSARSSNKSAQPGEIEVPPEFDQPDDFRAEDEVEYLQKLGNLAEGVIDLTTVDGISTFMRVVRIFSDIGPNRGTPIAGTPKTVVPDPVVPYTPPPPAVSPAQPVKPPTVTSRSGATTPKTGAAGTTGTTAQPTAQTPAQVRAAQQQAQEEAKRELEQERIANRSDPTGRGRTTGKTGGGDL